MKNVIIIILIGVILMSIIVIPTACQEGEINTPLVNDNLIDSVEVEEGKVTPSMELTRTKVVHNKVQIDYAYDFSFKLNVYFLPYNEMISNLQEYSLVYEIDGPYKYITYERVRYETTLDIPYIYVDDSVNFLINGLITHNWYRLSGGEWSIVKSRDESIMLDSDSINNVGKVEDMNDFETKLSNEETRKSFHIDIGYKRVSNSQIKLFIDSVNSKYDTGLSEEDSIRETQGTFLYYDVILIADVINKDKQISTYGTGNNVFDLQSNELMQVDTKVGSTKISQSVANSITNSLGYGVGRQTVSFTCKLLDLYTTVGTIAKDWKNNGEMLEVGDIIRIDNNDGVSRFMNQGQAVYFKITSCEFEYKGVPKLNIEAVEYKLLGRSITYRANKGNWGFIWIFPRTTNIVQYSLGETTQIDGIYNESAEESLSRDGYTFVNWNTSADGSGTTYNLGDNYTFGNNLELYAQWTPT